MPHFQYTARNAGGSLVKGDLEAASRKEAIRLIGARDLYPVSLKDGSGGGVAVKRAARKAASVKGKKVGGEKKAAHADKGEKHSTGSSGSLRSAKLSSRHALPFLRSLSELISSGMPVGDAVRLLSVRTKDQNLAKLAGFLWENVSAGQSISEAMAGVPRVFEEASVHLVRAGEATGNLDEILARLVTYYEGRNALRSQLINALAYPCFIIVIAIGVIFFFMSFLFPRMETLFDSLGGDIPASTRLLIDVSQGLMDYGIFVLVALVLAGVGVWRWWKTPQGRLKIDRMMLHVPGLRDFVIVNEVLQISQTLGALLENGVTTVEALKMTENVIRNREIRSAFTDARTMVVEGTSISGALQATGHFPDLVLDMLDVGENTGNIVPSLKEITRLYKGRVSQQLQLFTAVLSVGVLITAVVFVGFIAYAIFSAVFTLSGSFS